jgi:hypothetical protein
VRGDRCAQRIIIAFEKSIVIEGLDIGAREACVYPPPEGRTDLEMTEQLSSQLWIRADPIYTGGSVCGDRLPLGIEEVRSVRGATAFFDSLNHDRSWPSYVRAVANPAGKSRFGIETAGPRYAVTQRDRNVTPRLVAISNTRP